MQAQVHEASVAFTYAWWLTGDDEAAAAVVAEAARALAPADEGEARVATLLRAVRRLAAPERTMCPASELALLHDAQALPLELAADLADVAPDDARAELAHGRLEALLETVRRPFDHPERLGGLAVGNPADIAHARTCRSCADALELLRRGRQELASLPPIPAPPGVVAALTQLDETAAEAATTGPVRVSRREARPEPSTESPPESPPEPETETEAAAQAATAGGTEQAATAGGAEPAADTSPAGARPLFVFDDLAPLDLSTGGEEEGPDAPRRRNLLVGVGAVLFGLTVLLVTALTSSADLAGDPVASDVTGTRLEEPQLPDGGLEDPPGGTSADQQATTGAAPEEPSPEEPTAEPPTPAATDPDADPEAAQEPEPFTIVEAGVLPASDGEPQPSGARIGTDDALRVAIAYTGAGEGVELRVVPQLPAEEAAPRTVTLTSVRSSHVFVWPAPPEGWPPGRHQIQLLAGGALAGVVDVTVG